MEKPRYQRPTLEIIVFQHEQCLLQASQQGGVSGTISGYTSSSSGGFSQGQQSTPVKNQGNQDVWDDDWSKQ